MQIVIDMSEEEYNRIKENDCGLFNGRFFQMIRNGTPLPKGHGDLIDRKELLKQSMDKANYPSNYVQIAPTIIKADKEDEDE